MRAKTSTILGVLCALGCACGGGDGGVASADDAGAEATGTTGGSAVDSADTSAGPASSTESESGSTTSEDPPDLGSSETGDSSSVTTSDVTSTGDVSTSSSGGSSSEGESGSSGGIELPPEFPTDCDPSDFPVWVSGGGGFSTVQGALDGAPVGTTVFVCPGTYDEALRVERSVTLFGAGRELVTVEAGARAVALNLDPANTQVPNLITVRGLTLVGGGTGLLADRVQLELRELLVAESSEHGLNLNTVMLDAMDIEVRDVVSQVDGAGLRLISGSALLTDCVIEDNQTTAQGGGLYIRDADVTVTGGRVHRNSAAEGGGAYIAQNSFNDTLPLNVVNSDWGGGESNQNVGEDVWCSDIPFTIADTTSSWLGADATATCASGTSDPTCCEP